MLGQTASPTWTKTIRPRRDGAGLPYDGFMRSPALAAVEKLRRIAAALEAGRAPDPGDGAWLATRLRKYLDGAERGMSTLDLAFDLGAGLGGVTWVEEERRDRRDRLLRDMAARHFPRQEPGPAARSLAAAWRRYGRTRRGSDARRGESGASPGTLDGDLFALAVLGGPPAEKRLRDILAGAEQPEAA